MLVVVYNKKWTEGNGCKEHGYKGRHYQECNNTCVIRFDNFIKYTEYIGCGLNIDIGYYGVIKGTTYIR